MRFNEQLDAHTAGYPTLCQNTVSSSSLLILEFLSGLVGRHAEHLTIKELNAIHKASMFAVGFEVSPTFRIWIINFLMIPANARYILWVVRCKSGSHAKGIWRLGRWHFASLTFHCNHLALVKHVIHGTLPFPGNVRVPKLGVQVLFLQLPKPVHCPIIQFLSWTRRDFQLSGRIRDSYSQPPPQKKSKFHELDLGVQISKD